MERINKFLITFILILPIIFFSHTGFSIDSLIRNIQVVLFSLAFSFILYYSEYKKYVFVLSLIFIIGMGICFIAGFIDLADTLGSSGFGLLLFLLFSYLPQFVRKGYIEKI